ncbi:MAG TPA: TetR/AcrR family transcriptional regulator [Streptosporangiaceae bacterium]|nr:TetR/AcrR family transcriptional regulator [Streptosporangiaceae bacterium]
MGNREDLIAGAKRCLLEKGYAATTARDIAAASGVSLAAIGYHFGSKDALMNQAVFDSIGDWADELQRGMDADEVLDGPPLRRFEAAADRTLASFGGPDHGLWAAQLELMGLVLHNDDLRAFLASVQGFAGQGIAELFLGIDADADPEVSRLAGTVMHALFIGLMAKYYLDPKQAPTAQEFAAGLRIVAQRALAGSPGGPQKTE